MNQSTVIAATQLPGISDLPFHAKIHFAKALIAEQDGEYLLAEFELHRAVAEEAKAAAAPTGNTSIKGGKQHGYPTPNHTQYTT